MLQFGRTTTTKAPWVSRQGRSGHTGDADEVVFKAHFVRVRSDARPDKPFLRIRRNAGLLSPSSSDQDLVSTRRLVCAKEQYRWCPVTREASASRVDNLGHVYGRQELF